MAWLGNRGPTKIHAATHKITACCMLSAWENPDGSWTDLNLTTVQEATMTEPEMLDVIDRFFVDIVEKAGTCVTFNGMSHDVPVIKRRAARHWLFDRRGITDIDQCHHEDLMRRMTRGWRDDWPSLAAACAGLGIPIDHHPIDKKDRTSMTVLKCETDVYATFSLLLFELAIRRRQRSVLDQGWSALQAFTLRNRPRAQHLAQFGRAFDAAPMP